MHKTIYMQDAVYEMAKIKAHAMGVSMSRVVQRAIEQFAGENEQSKALDHILAVAKSKQFAKKLTNIDEFLKEERRKSDREL